MTRASVGLAAIALALVLAPEAFAAPPQINGITPFGARRGEAVDVSFKGANLGGNPRLWAPFAFKVVEPLVKGSDGSTWNVKLVADPSTAVGVYPVRVQTDAGLSNPFLFAVGQLPQVAEKEDNSTFEAAQAVSAPCVVEGQTAGNDVDYFRFAGKKGQKVLVDAQCARIGSGVDPSIRLTTAARKYVASADDTAGLLTDARLVATLPEDGDYVVELSDSRYQGGGRPIYRLVVGEVPVAEEVYPMGGRAGETIGLELRGGTVGDNAIAAVRINPAMGLSRVPPRIHGSALGLTGPLGALDVESLPPLVVSRTTEVRETVDNLGPVARSAPPVVFNGRIDKPGAEERFVLAVTPGQKLRIEVDAAESGSALDGVLQILGAKNAVLATADDTTEKPTKKPANAQTPPQISPDPSFATYTVPAGLTELTLALKDLESRGGVGYPFRISVTPITPDVELTLDDDQVSVPKGGTASVGVTVVRRGYTGPIALKVVDPPAGLSVRPGTIAEGQLLGAFSISAAPDAKFDPTPLKVVGEIPGPDGPVQIAASKTIVFAQQATIPTNFQPFAGLAAAPASPFPVRLETPDGPIEVAHGCGVPVVVKAVRDKGADAALPLTTLPLPPGLTVPAVSIAEKKNEATLAINTAIEHPIGTVSIAIQSKAKLNGAQETLAAPTITLNVVRPATLEVAAKAVELKQGATVEIKGKIARKPGFAEPVTVKMNGLPTGLKAEPVTLKPDATEFTLKLVADAKAAPAASNGATVALAFQIAKKDYPASITAPVAIKVVAAAPAGK